MYAIRSYYDTRRIQSLDPVRSRMRGKHGFDLALERVDVLQPRGQVDKSGVGQPLRLVADRRAEVLP